MPDLQLHYLEMRVYLRVPRVMDFSHVVKNILHLSGTRNFEHSWHTGNARAGQTNDPGPTLSVVGPNSHCQMDSMHDLYGLSPILHSSHAKHLVLRYSLCVEADSY
jgi:hypothetical protein